MFSQPNPRLIGPRSPRSYAIKDIQGDGYISVLTNREIGQATLLFNTANIFQAIAEDYDRYTDVNPVGALLGPYSIEGAPATGEGVALRFENCGNFSGASQFIELQANGNVLCTLGASSGTGPWLIRWTVSLVSSNESIISGFYQGPGTSGVFQFSDLDGTGFSIDWSGGVSIDIIATDTVGSGVAMTSDSYMADYRCSSKSK